MRTWLLFTNGGSSSDPLNLDSSEIGLFSPDDLKTMKPNGPNDLDLVFDVLGKTQIVTLKVKNGSHVRVMTSITNAIEKSNQSTISIADIDANRFVNSNIYGVNIKSQETFTQTLTGSTKTKINTTNSNYSSCLITNTHSSAVTVTLKLVSQVGSDITATDVYAAETEAASTSSVALTVDNGSGSASDAANDEFLNERVYKSDGTFFGACTTVTSTTVLTFANGLESAITNNDILYTGTRYTLLNTVSIPANTVLKLESDEISFDDTKYNLYAYSGDGSGYLTFTFNY